MLAFIQLQVLKKVYQFPKEFLYIEMPEKLQESILFDFENYEPQELINYLNKFGYKL